VREIEVVMQAVTWAMSQWIVDDAGVTSSEYAPLGAPVAIAIFVGAEAPGGSVGNLYRRIAAGVSAAIR
jgi:Flp pilus assembly pilin Flp